jgi:hypothetical protein
MKRNHKNITTVEQTVRQSEISLKCKEINHYLFLSYAHILHNLFFYIQFSSYPVTLFKNRDIIKVF